MNLNNTNNTNIHVEPVSMTPVQQQVFAGQQKLHLRIQPPYRPYEYPFRPALLV